MPVTGMWQEFGVGRQRLLWTADHTPKLSTSITPAELDLAHADAMGLVWSAEAREAFESILRELAAEGVRPGNRRQFKTVGACRAFAYLCGANRVEPEHLEVAAHCLWDAPEEQPQKAAEVVARIANPTGMRVNQLLLECEQVVSGCDVRNLSSAATAAAKLGEIDRALAGLKSDARVARARAHVKDQVKRLKLASLEAV
jgi:MoxR-like ATPase